LALLIVGAAVGARLLLDFVIPSALPFITFFPAVLLITFLCGVRPGILSLALTAFLGVYWADPSGQKTVLFYSVALLLYVSFAGSCLWLVHSLVEALARLKRQDEQLGMINRELKHRIKNLFSIANSVCLQTLRSGKAIDEMGGTISGRLAAIAAAQDLLSVTAQDGAEVGELVGALVVTLTPDPSRLQADGERVTLSPQVTTPFALILHELGTNALKYGAWSHDKGIVKATWVLREATLHFRWREHDGPAIAPPMHEGLGRTLIKNSLPGAVVSHDLKADGLECTIELPLERA
jgi:two-component sensor histidine kinase